MLSAPNSQTVARLAHKVVERCDTLAAFSDDPGRLTRTFLCPAMHEVHAALSGWMESAGMVVRVDGAGNLIGQFSSQQGAPHLLIGSHLDTVPNAGRYDGVLGVLLGLAAVEALDGQALPFGIDIIGFSEEEGVRFGAPYLGSLAVTGGLTPDLLARRDPAGVSVADAIRSYGLDPDDVPAARYSPETVIGYLEAHIEQGPVLERLDLPLGIAIAIAGQTRARVTWTGQAGHAGTTPMTGRRDALAAAAEFVLAAETLALHTEGLVATVGQIDAAPGAGNVIPGTVILSLDVRHATDTVREAAMASLRARSEEVVERRDVACEWQILAQQTAVSMDSDLSDLLAQAVGAAGQPVHSMVSGAGHDAAILAHLTPAALLFLRSPGGLSHHPDEAVLAGDVAAALEALVQFLCLLEEKYVMRPTL